MDHYGKHCWFAAGVMLLAGLLFAVVVLLQGAYGRAHNGRGPGWSPEDYRTASQLVAAGACAAAVTALGIAHRIGFRVWYLASAICGLAGVVAVYISMTRY